MRLKKKCRFCRKWFQPYPHTHREQIACLVASCQRERRHRAWRRWNLKNPLYDDSRRQKKKQWAQKNAAAYMQTYRQAHAAYVRRNRWLQKRRDAKRRNLVKTNAWNRVPLEKLARIRSLGLLVKTNAYAEVMKRQIDGICDVLAQSTLLVKPNALGMNGGH
jgi:hypothetical protein